MMWKRKALRWMFCPFRAAGLDVPLLGAVAAAPRHVHGIAITWAFADRVIDERVTSLPQGWRSACFGRTLGAVGRQH